MDKEKKKKIIYVMSPAYSGSTIFGLALGKHPQIINLGEVTNLENDYKSTAKCTCGQKLKDCHFWSKIKSLIDKDFSLSDSFNLSNAGKRELLDRKGGIEKIKLLWGQNISNNYSLPYLNRYKLKNEKFFSSVFQAFPEQEFLIDLSKSSERLEVLLSSEKLDVWCIYLTREPLKIFASTIKRPKKTRRFFGPKNIREAIWLKARIKDMEQTFEKIPVERKIKINFDEFCHSPHTTLNRVFSFLCIPPLENHGKQDFIIEPQQQHIYVGNRWLFRNPAAQIIIKEQNDITRMSFLDLLVFKIIW